MAASRGYIDAMYAIQQQRQRIANVPYHGTCVVGMGMTMLLVGVGGGAGANMPGASFST